MKIAYVIEVMHNSGGMERVLSVCANALCQELDVSIITLYQKGRPAYFPLDNRIHCYDLGLDGVANRKLLKSRLSEFLMTHHFDTVISLGGMDMYYLHSIQDGSRKIVWFHFAFNISVGAWLGESASILNKCRGYLQLARRIYHARKFDMVVAISKSDYIAWKRCVKNVVRIPNPVSFRKTGTADLITNAVISVGRLDIQKGYNYLIDAWSIVARKYPTWKLDIYGEGVLKKQLQDLIYSHHLEKQVILCGSTPDIVSKYLEHSIYVSSSITEAFSLVLIEASTCGLPLVAFDCPSGPRDIIVNGKNGFLIDNVGDVQTMASRICQLIESEFLRREMGANALQMVDGFSIETIMEQWKNLFESISLNSLNQA